MTTQRFTDQWRYRRHSLSVLMLFLTVALSLWLTKPAQAATTTISDQASCEAFGGSVQNGACEVSNSKTIAAGDSLAEISGKEQGVAVGRVGLACGLVDGNVGRANILRRIASEASSLVDHHTTTLDGDGAVIVQEACSSADGEVAAVPHIDLAIRHIERT